MKETGVLFKEDMREAKRDGTKTQSRRVMNPQPEITRDGTDEEFRVNDGPWRESCRMSEASAVAIDGRFKSPWGRMGDRIYTKEPHYLWGMWSAEGRTKSGKQAFRFICLDMDQVKFPDNPPVLVHTERHKVGWFRRNSLFMPKWCARDWATLTDVRVDKIQDITAYDALMEGIDLPEVLGATRPPQFPDGFDKWSKDKQEEWFHSAARTTYFAQCIDADDHVKAFHELWDRMNLKRGHGWNLNEWVWAYTWENDE